MNFKSILKEIEKTDPEVYERLSDRRHILKSFGSKVAVAALPIALGSLFKKAYGKTTATSDVISALNFALEMEYFEYNFWHTGNSTGGLIPTADAAGFLTIEAHEKAHILFLNTTVTTLGGTPYTPNFYNPLAVNPLYIPAAYDFTAGGAYPNTFDNYPSFLVMAQIFEDTGVHAYKGQIPTLFGNAGILTQAFQIQSVEGRHAAHVRLIRRNAGAAENPAPWISNNIPPPPILTSEPESQFQPFYIGEDNTLQVGGVDITTLPDAYATGGTVPKASATAAFDESMDMVTISALLRPFLL